MDHVKKLLRRLGLYVDCQVIPIQLLSSKSVHPNGHSFFKSLKREI